MPCSIPSACVETAVSCRIVPLPSAFKSMVVVDRRHAVEAAATMMTRPRRRKEVMGLVYSVLPALSVSPCCRL